MKYQFNNITARHHGLPVSHESNTAHCAKGGAISAFKILDHLFGGPRIFAIVGLLTLAAAAAAPAADTPEAATAYRPGDTVRVFVAFKEPIILKYGDLRFVLNGDLPEGQKVFANSFDLTTLVKSSEREYEFQTKVTDHMASGTYRLIFIAATDQADFSRNFNTEPDFPAVTICVRNDRHVEFPGIKTIRVAGQADSKP